MCWVECCLECLYVLYRVLYRVFVCGVQSFRIWSVCMCCIECLYVLYSVRMCSICWPGISCSPAPTQLMLHKASALLGYTALHCAVLHCID